ncbi:helix-turn-helix transcriptional regulator [Hydrogenophaga crassostreae]|uniref:Helix-turn-helix transcriptional regulator n=1 Tax=Hydrogenophaga crassostreae TaxID=1763535 RepID=A0A163CP48_9BURK|nr:alpha/beta fold hydrolase [Hydrogenophaga crassostreae]AOW14056.1 helix-turn-helix transcriptional regulator [Hydrogenophaga crassostreae]OAD43981.1 helix-turn-helix transcriptional regulator [Hydrogenophaga crassostreae]
MKAKTPQTLRFCRSTDGVQIAYATIGQGPPLVRAAHFLTHLEFDLVSPVWLPWLRELSNRRQLVRYDARGCGLSDMDSAPQTLDAWVADLEAVVDAAGLERFALLGCSQGCAVSIAYAVRHPERVSCLVVLGGYLRGPMRRDPTPSQIKEAKLMVDLIELGWGRDNPAFRQVFTSQFIPDGSPEQVQWFNELERLSTSPAHAARVIAAFGQIDVTEMAAQISCPTLVLHARGDARVPFEEGRRTAGMISGARFVPLDSRSHALLADEPAFAQCFGEIQAFLDEHQAQACPSLAFPDLSPGERALLELLAHGLDNLQIAAHLGLAEKTVRNKVSAVFVKLDAATRAQAIVRAREAGFGAQSLPR